MVSREPPAVSKKKQETLSRISCFALLIPGAVRFAG